MIIVEKDDDELIENHSPTMTRNSLANGKGMSSVLNIIDKDQLDEGEEDFLKTLQLRDNEGLSMRNASSIRYQKKLRAKAHSIRINDVCDSDCSKDHKEHPASEAEGPIEE